MSVENEGELTIPFIDEGEEQESNTREGNEGQYNLTITRNYQNKTRRVEISKILQDVEPMTNRSLSPLAPLAYESDPEEGKRELSELTGAEFELTIKSNNSVIKIQGFDNKSTISFNARGGGNVYDYLSKEVDKIFKKPEREEIEKAMKSIKEKRKLKPICRQKRNTWKTLAKSIVGFRGGRSSQRRGSVERYPKMVLLQEAKPPAGVEEKYPKMVKLDVDKENEEIEKCKTNLKRGKTVLNEEKKMLNKKKEAVEDKKTNLGDKTADERFLKKEMDIIAEEKLCMELEKQLLGEEKDMLKEEMDLLKKEKEVLQKEKDLLGEKKKKQSEDVEKKPQTSAKPLPQQHSFEAEDLSYPSVPPIYCQYPTHCPYMPVYNRPLPYYHYNEICCSGRVDPPAPQKHSSTQTDPAVGQQIETLNSEKDMDLPFGILSSLFPRIVVMKSFQEEVSSDDAQIYEIPKSETPPPENEKEDEKACEEPEPVQLIDVELDKEEEEEELNGSATEEPMPLTKIGYSIYDKINELAVERKKEAEESSVEAEEEVEAAETETRKSPRDVTLEFSNRLVKFTLGDDNLNFEITDGNNEKTIVRKSDLWHSSNGFGRRSGGDTARGSDQICVSVSDNRKVIFTVRLGEERKWTTEAKVGTDGIDLAGGDFVCREGTNAKNLSPRTDELLRSLKDKLDKVDERKNSTKSREFKFPGLFLVQPFDSRYRGFPSDDYIMTKRRDVSAAKSREYYCEECLATMRLIEDENPTVRAMVDKFERIIHLGSY